MIPFMVKLTPPVGAPIGHRCVSDAKVCCTRWIAGVLGLVSVLFLGLANPASLRADTAGQGGVSAQGSRSYNPITPYDALIAGQSGWAEISFTVDYSGRAILLNVESCSDRSFAKAFMADVEAVEFIPPRRNGQPLMSVARERYDFSGKPSLDPVAQEILQELRKPTPGLCPEAELDAKPQAIRQPPSAYPWALRGDEESGQAEIEFVIDRNGRVLFPRIISATHDDFGWAAATAVTHWKFKPPTKGGKPVDTRVKDTLVFDIKKAGGMW